MVEVEAIVLNYNKSFSVGTCKDTNNKIYFIYKKHAKSSFDYLEVGERIKGVKHYNFHGRCVLIDIEPVTSYRFKTHPEMNYVCV